MEPIVIPLHFSCGKRKKGGRGGRGEGGGRRLEKGCALLFWFLFHLNFFVLCLRGWKDEELVLKKDKMPKRKNSTFGIQKVEGIPINQHVAISDSWEPLPVGWQSVRLKARECRFWETGLIPVSEKPKQANKAPIAGPRRGLSALFASVSRVSSMAASGQMMSQFQKHFNSEIEEVVDSRTITFAQLAEHFHLPINEVFCLFFLFAPVKSVKSNFSQSMKESALHRFHAFCLNLISPSTGGQKTWGVPHCPQESLQKTRNSTVAVS